MKNARELKAESSEYEDELLAKFEKNYPDLVKYAILLLNNASKNGKFTMAFPTKGPYYLYEYYLARYLEKRGYVVVVKPKKELIISWT